MEPVIHDNDGSAWEGNVMSSPTNTDNAWQTTAVWSYSFIGAGGTAIDDVEAPATYALSTNYPNPFNPSTIINYEIGQSELVKLTVYNVLGQEVMVLVNDFQQAGAHEIQFQAGALASGIYMYRLEAGNFTSTQKMILMK
ncbi:MAG: T9SS type A sorting domain-containing protein [Candidatus Marinimicrobia bacterium]|nr:T9SS type A sorting domain-containing protein [Candidatus Neomarinimicrobiota bacterium]